MDSINNPLISIIIPVYNVEKYLRLSLESIFVQDTSDCEVLAINDGSTDNSINILREFARTYDNLRIIDKSNEGVSTTRNRGLDECRGEYFYFMDSDDMLHPQFLSILKKEIREFHSDMVVWDYATFYTKPNFISTSSCIKVENVMNDQKQAFDYLMVSGSAVSLCCKAIKRKLVGDTIRIDSSMTFGEDMFFCWKATLLANTIRYIRFPLYYYLQSGNSATTRFHPCLYEHYRKAFDDIRHFLNMHGINDKRVIDSIDYHFVCRIPALTTMEAKAPYSKQEQMKHLKIVLQDEYIRRGLLLYTQLDGKLFKLARENNVYEMLKYARKKIFISKFLYPIKRMFK